MESTVHLLCDVVLFWTMRGHVFTLNTALSTECDELIIHEFSPVIRSQTLQFTICLILDHCQPFLEDRKDFVFGSGRVHPKLSSGVVNEGHEVRCGIGPHTWECTKSSGLDSRGVNTGCGTNVCLSYWQCSQNWWSKKESFTMYPALDRCVILDLLKCPILPCQRDDTGRSTRKSLLSLRVTYNGYNECTFVPRASRRLPRWSDHPPKEKMTRMPASTSCPTKINDLRRSGKWRMSCRTSIEPPRRLSSTDPIPTTAQCWEFPTRTGSKSLAV